MTDPSPDLHNLFRRIRWVLLDFDGPVCDVYAGHPAELVAEKLRTELRPHLTSPLPEDVETTNDPLYIVRRVADLAPELVKHVDGELRRAEVDAMATARPTPGAVEFLDACTDSGRPVGIVSNNSAEAVHAYLDHHGYAARVAAVVGRDTDPKRMKPEPFPLTCAVELLGADLSATVLIGDSTTDVEAARAASVAVIGYVNVPKKAETLGGADVLVTDMNELARVSRAIQARATEA